MGLKIRFLDSGIALNRGAFLMIFCKVFLQSFHEKCALLCLDFFDLLILIDDR